MTLGPARRSRRALRRAVAVRFAGGAVLLGILSMFTGAGAATAADENDPDVNLRVTVGPAAAPGPAATSTTTTTRTTTVTSVGDGPTVVTGDLNPPAPAADEFSLGGILYVSGLSTEYSPSVNPLEGSLHTQFTVLNVSTATIDSTARFWVTNFFGGQIGEVGPLDIQDLKPNESRVVDATLGGVGQWTFATAHFTLTPPATVDDVPLEPLTRDAFVFLPPWFLLALAAIGGVVYVIVRIIRYSDAPVIDDAALTGSTA